MGQKQSVDKAPTLPEEGQRNGDDETTSQYRHSSGYEFSGRPCPVPGLVNEGNTCYLNGVLQALASVPPAVHYLYKCVNMNGAACELLDRRRWRKGVSSGSSQQSSDSDLEDDWDEEDSMMQEELQASYNLSRQMARLVCDLNHGAKKGSSRVMKEYLANTGILFLVDGGQQDAHELLFGTIWAAIADEEVNEATKTHSAVFRGLTWISSKSSNNLLMGDMDIHSVCPYWNIRKRMVVRGAATRSHRRRSSPLKNLASRKENGQIVASTDTNDSTTLSQSTNGSELKTTVNHVPKDPFTGIISRRTTCVRCGHGDPWKSEDFTCLSLVLPSVFPLQRQILGNAVAPQNSVTLEQLLRNYFGHEAVQDWRCENCGDHGCRRRSRLSRLPEVLCIHLQRNSCGIRNKTPVKFKEHLRMDTLRGAPLWDLQSIHTGNPSGSSEHSFFDEDDSSDRENDYVLMSIVRHVGGASGGHYIAYRRQPFYGTQHTGRNDDAALRHDGLHEKANTWLACNDRSVSSFDSVDLFEGDIQESVYLLFYMRVHRNTVRQVYRGEHSSVGESSIFCPRLNDKLGLPGYPRWPVLEGDCDMANCRKYYFPFDSDAFKPKLKKKKSSAEKLQSEFIKNETD